MKSSTGQVSQLGRLRQTLEQMAAPVAERLARVVGDLPAIQLAQPAGQPVVEQALDQPVARHALGLEFGRQCQQPVEADAQCRMAWPLLVQLHQPAIRGRFRAGAGPLPLSVGFLLDVEVFARRRQRFT